MAKQLFHGRAIACRQVGNLGTESGSCDGSFVALKEVISVAIMSSRLVSWKGAGSSSSTVGNGENEEKKRHGDVRFTACLKRLYSRLPAAAVVETRAAHPVQPGTLNTTEESRSTCESICVRLVTTARISGA